VARRLVVVTDHGFDDLRREREVAAAHGADLVYAAVGGGRGDPGAVAAAVAGAAVIMVGHTRIDRQALAALAPGATVVRVGVGTDNLDLEAARDLGIEVANVPDYGAETVADHAVACLLSLLRRLPQYQGIVRRSGWGEPGDVGHVRGLRSTVVGLVGFGRIAQAVHRRLVPFGVEVIATDPGAAPDVFAATGVERVGLDELTARAHAISLHVPATPATRHLVDSDFLASLQPGAVVVNTARGSLVDHDALADALLHGTLGGAALDVTEPEPLPIDHRLRTIESVVITPHVAYYDADAFDTLQQLSSDEVGRALRGEPLRCRVC
jgi:D-3-phosphoglycerate dehydrogenase